VQFFQTKNAPCIIFLAEYGEIPILGGVSLQLSPFGHMGIAFCPIHSEPIPLDAL
jgi:hypothetical protein